MFPDPTKNVNSRTPVFRISNKPLFFYSGRQGRDAASLSKWFVLVITGVAKKANEVRFSIFFSLPFNLGVRTAEHSGLVVLRTC
jgi:hypothetical protein